MDDTKFDRKLPSSLARAIRFEHRIHSLDVTLVLWLTASHTWVARAKLFFAPLAGRVQAGCCAFPFYTPTKPLMQVYFKYKNIYIPKLKISLIF